MNFNWLSRLTTIVAQKAHYKELSIERKLYLIGAVVNLTVVAIWPLVILFKINNAYLFFAPLIFGCTLSIIGLVIEARKVVERAKSILRPVLLVLSTTVVYLSAVLVRHSINWATGHDPTNYPTTTVVFSVIVAVTLWIGLTALIAFGVQLVALVLPAFKSALKLAIGPGETAYDLSAMGRLYALFPISAVLIAVFIFLAGLFTLLYENDAEVLRAVRTVVVTVDYYHNVGYCSNFILQKERAVFLDGGLISVAIPDSELGYRFEIRQCEVAAPILP